LNSWITHPREFPQACDPLREWRFGTCKNAGTEDYFGFYKWKEVANLYLDLEQKYADRVLLVVYEDLVDDPLGKAGEVFDFMGLDLEGQTRDFLVRSTREKKASPYAVYKDRSVRDRWRAELDEHIVTEVLADLEGTRLARFLR